MVVNFREERQVNTLKRMGFGLGFMFIAACGSEGSISNQVGWETLDEGRAAVESENAGVVMEWLAAGVEAVAQDGSSKMTTLRMESRESYDQLLRVVPYVVLLGNNQEMKGTEVYLAAGKSALFSVDLNQIFNIEGFEKSPAAILGVSVYQIEKDNVVQLLAGIESRVLLQDQKSKVLRVFDMATLTEADSSLQAPFLFAELADKIEVAPDEIQKIIELSTESAGGYRDVLETLQKALLDDDLGDTKSIKYDLTCFEAEPSCAGCGGDFDGDGYVETAGSVARTFQRRLSERFVCPSGWVPARGDCDDDDRFVHPARNEWGRDFRDNDCDGFVDEFEYLYSDGGFANHDNGFDMGLTVNDMLTPLIWLWGGDIYVKVEYGRLQDHPATTVSDFLPAWIDRYTATADDGISEERVFTMRVTLDGLNNATIYRGRIHSVYLQSRSSGEFLEIPYSRANQWYFTSTKRIDNRVSRARTRMLLQGFHENYLQEIGLVGITGTRWINGSRYGARDNELWCTEFYAWLGDQAGLDGIGNEYSSTGLRHYFDGWGSYNHYWETTTIAGLETRSEPIYRADWLNLSDEEHTAMFLAIDSEGELWTLEGNTTNSDLHNLQHSVGIRHGTNSRGLIGFGHITDRCF